jgi:hypothetical protein
MQLLDAVKIIPSNARGCPTVSIGQSLEALNSLAKVPKEFDGDCDGIDALCYHLSGGTCKRAIENLQRVLARFKEIEEERMET